MNELFYRTELQKDDSGFSLKVPDNFVEELDFKEKEIIEVTIKKIDKLKVPKVLLDVYRKHMPELAELSDEDWSTLLDFNNREKVSSMNEEEILTELENKFSKNLAEKYKQFKENLQKLNKEDLKKDLEIASKL